MKCIMKHIFSFKFVIFDSNGCFFEASAGSESSMNLMYLVGISSLMKYLRDGFLRELDNEDYGIKGHIEHFDRILHVSDEKVWEILV